MRAGQAAAEGYIGRWRPSSVSPQAAAFARDVISRAGPLERERAKNLLWAAGKLADYATGLGLEAVPEVLLHPRAAEGSPGALLACPGWRAARCVPACGSSAAASCRSCIPRICRCRGRRGPDFPDRGSNRILAGKERNQVPGKPKHYTPEFKEQAVKKVVDSSPPRTITEVARELNINNTTLGCAAKAYGGNSPGRQLPSDMPDGERSGKNWSAVSASLSSERVLEKSGGVLREGAAVSEKYEFIDAECATLPAEGEAPTVVQMCEWLGYQS